MAALLEGYCALMNGARRTTKNKHTMAGEKRHRGVAHLLDSTPRARRVIHRSRILVHQAERSPTKRRALIQDRWDLAHVGPNGSIERMVMDRPSDSGTQLVELEVQRDSEWHRPIAVNDASFEVYSKDL